LLADRLAGKTIHAIYASHLARAVETARALAEPRGMPIGVYEDLQEVLLGDWGNGEFRRRAAVRDPQWLAWEVTGRWDGIPGGEGDAALRARVARVVRELATRHVGETIAVVAHGGAINACVADIFGIERTMWMSCENTSITTLHVTAERTMVIGANDCSHLYDPVLGAPS
jgi:broad specificity phosphatase PhoE